MCDCIVFIMHAQNIVSTVSLELVDGQERMRDTGSWSEKEQGTNSLGRNLRMHVKYLKDRFNYKYLILRFGYPSHFAGTNNYGFEKKIKQTD